MAFGCAVAAEIVSKTTAQPTRTKGTRSLTPAYFHICPSPSVLMRPKRET